MRQLSIVLLALLPIVLSVPARAEEPTRSQQSFGMVAGRLGGLGFTYRRFREDGWGYGLGGIALWSSGSLSGNLGLQGYRTLHQAATGRLYLLAGGSVFGGFAEGYALGAGPGIEIGGPLGPALAVEVPLTYVSTQGWVMVPTLCLLYGF